MNKATVTGVALGALTWATLAQDVPNPAASGDTLSELINSCTNSWRHIAAGPIEVSLGGGPSAKHVVFRQTQWEPKEVDQVFNAHKEMAMRNLPEAERIKVMHRIDDYSEMWFVRAEQSSNVAPSLRAALSPGSYTNQYFREMAHLGNINGYACFAFMPIPEWINIQKALDLQNGDDPIAAGIRGLPVEDSGSMTANSCLYLLADAGNRSVPYLKPLLSTTNATRAIRSLFYNQSSEATELLIDCANPNTPEIARASKHYLSARPRKEALELYFRWLTEDAGRTNVESLLTACATLDKPRLLPVLPKVLESPSNAREMRMAFDLSRSISGNPIPPALTNAEAIIRRSSANLNGTNSRADYDMAIATLTSAKDVEAAAHIGLSLATATGKGFPREANQAGIFILKNLPHQTGLKLARVLHGSCHDENVRRALGQLVE